MISTQWGDAEHASLSEHISNLIQWDKDMRRTYRIELKIELSEADSHEVMLDIAKRYARDLLASAMLVSENRRPAVALMTDDSFTGTEQIELMAPSETLHT